MTIGADAFILANDGCECVRGYKKGGATASASVTPPERVKGSIRLHSVHYSPACL